MYISIYGHVKWEESGEVMEGGGGYPDLSVRIILL